VKIHLSVGNTATVGFLCFKKIGNFGSCYIKRLKNGLNIQDKVGCIFLRISCCVLYKLKKTIQNGVDIQFDINFFLFFISAGDNSNLM
jgi:hypothetical protein